MVILFNFVHLKLTLSFLRYKRQNKCDITSEGGSAKFIIVMLNK